MRNVLQWLLILVVLLASAACAAPAATPTPTPRPPPTAMPTAPPPTAEPPAAPSGPTAAQVAELGAGVYAQSCARCHGEQGEGRSGPALVGAGTNIQRHGDAFGLVGYFSARMPPAAPGSLSEEQYAQILAWILLENALVEPSVVWEELELADISLAK